MWKWNPGIISSFLQMSSRSNPKSLFVIKFQLRYSSSRLSFFKSYFRGAINMLENFVFQSLELLWSWTVGLKTPTLYAVKAEVIELNNRKIKFKMCHVFLPEENHETRIAEREEVKITGLNKSWKWLLFLIFYAYQELETLEKNGGASIHTWQLQEKIWEKLLQFPSPTHRTDGETATDSRLTNKMSNILAIFITFFETS